MQYPPFKAFIMILGKLVISIINDFYNFGEKKSDNKLLFGPYPNAYAARRIVNLINRLYIWSDEGLCEGSCIII